MYAVPLMFRLVNTIRFSTFPNIPNVQIIGKITPYDSFLKFSVRGSSNDGYSRDEKQKKRKKVHFCCYIALIVSHCVLLSHSWEGKYHYTSFKSNQRVDQRVSREWEWPMKTNKLFNREGQPSWKFRYFQKTRRQHAEVFVSQEHFLFDCACCWLCDSLEQRY